MKLFIFMISVLFCECITIAQNNNIIIGIDIQKLMQNCLQGKKISFSGISKYGVAFNWSEESESFKNSIRIGVYSDSFEAKNRFTECIRFTSRIQLMNTNFPIGNDVLIMNGRILFRRDNALVNIYNNNDSILNMAKALDDSLVKGTNGVRRGNELLVPRITGFSMDGACVIAKTEPQADGFSAIVDNMGQVAMMDSANAICFATKWCVMAKPFKCDAETLKQRLAIEQARKNEEAKLNEAEFRRQVEILESAASGFEARKDAILILANSNDKRAVPVLIAEIDRLDKTADPFVLRCLAIRGLGMLRSQKAVVRLGEFLRKPPKGNVNAEDEDSEAIDRREAINSLWLIGGESARMVIEEVSKNTNEYMSVKLFAEAKLKTMK